jgi:hypothetical protein
VRGDESPRGAAGDDLVVRRSTQINGSRTCARVATTSSRWSDHRVAGDLVELGRGVRGRPPAAHQQLGSQ